MRTLISLALVAAASPAWAAAVQGDGSTITQTREVGSFTGVRLETSADVVVKVGQPVRVAVTAESSLQPHVKTEVRGGVLVIDAENGVQAKSPVRVEVSVPGLEKVEVQGSGTVIVDGARGDSELSIDGSGDLRWTGEAGALEVEIEGSGNVMLAGTAAQLAIEISGSGDVDATELRARNADVEVEGSGDVAVHLDGGRLRAEVSGSGDVEWSGSGTVERAVAEGSGEIRRR